MFTLIQSNDITRLLKFNFVYNSDRLLMVSALFLCVSTSDSWYRNKLLYKTISIKISLLGLYDITRSFHVFNGPISALFCRYLCRVPCINQHKIDTLLLQLYKLLHWWWRVKLVVNAWSQFVFQSKYSLFPLIRHSEILNNSLVANIFISHPMMFFHADLVCSCN